MNTRDLVVKLRQLGIKLSVSDGELRVSAPKGVMTAELREELKSQKDQLIELLSAGASGTKAAATRIPRADRNQTIPLSFAQKRMWFLEEFEGGTSIYNISWAMRLEGQLDDAALEGAINDLVARHESLRTTFAAEEGEPAQVIAPHIELRLERSSLPSADTQKIEKQLSKWSAESFDLRTGPLLKARLVDAGPDNHILMMVIHHIVADAWSLDVLQRELVAFYIARSSGTDAGLGELPIQFADYTIWQQGHINEAERKRQLAYWQKQLAGAPPVLELPTDRPRPNEQTYRGARIRRLMPAGLRDTLKVLARENNGTLFMVLLAAFDVLLYRYSGQEDIVVGTPIAGRQRSELEALIGLFLNTLVMRADLAGDPTFKVLLGQVQTAALDAFAHQDLPFEKLVEELAPERDMSYSPVFQVLFMLQNAPASGEPLAGLHIEPVEFDYGTAKFDLTLATGETPDGLVAEIEYSTDLFDAATIERMLEHYEILLAQIASNPARPISQLELISAAERKRLLTDWNATAVDYPAEATLASLLEAQAAATPDAEALVFCDESLTFAELNARANQLAHCLIGQGTQPDDLIGVCMERSIEMVIALLGVIKAGLAYVPLDPDYPEQRLAHMLEDAGIKVLLSQSGAQSALPRHNVPMLLLDEAHTEFAAQAKNNPPARASAESLAYVIFTSGSTGRPKGVMNEHGGIVNRLLWMQDEYGLTSDDRVLQKTPFSFDVSVWEFFWPLISGATLVVAKPGGHKDPAYLAELINAERITTLHFVPSMLQVLLQDAAAKSCTTLRRVICSGEAMSHDLQTRFYNMFAEAGLHNLYGPTEAAIDVTYWACPREAALGVVPIGRPVANTHIYIVDKAGNPTPVGVPGELWIGGIQVARGYVNRPDLTTERFIRDPFSTSTEARVYRTGDLVRFRADGVIEFLGRMDHQVKLRGFRIELGEIESSLDALPEIEQSLVLLREDVPGDKRLVAYVSGTRDVAPDAPALRQALQRDLPDYMVPSAFVVLDAFPLLPNGKVDRNALPEPDGRRDLESVYEPPRNTVEQQLAEIWSTLLRVDRVGIHDNFFELGGDSILSIQIIARAAKVGLHLTPKQVFRHQTIAELAETAGTGVPIIAQQGLISGAVKFTPVENWFLELDATDRHHFNQSVLLQIDGDLNADIVAQALGAIYRHHDALRLQLKADNGNWTQQLADLPASDTSPHLLRSDIANLDAADQAQTICDLANESQASIDLRSGCLLAARYFERGTEQPALLLLAIHHLAIDGVGWRILLEDLETVCRQLLCAEPAQLPAKTSALQAWTDHLHDYAHSAEVALQLDYWQAATTGITRLPLDKPDGRNNVGTARTIQVELDAAETTALLKDAPGAYRTRINDVLLAALARAVDRWTGASSCLVDLEAHGREQLFDDLDVSRTLGWFTSIYPVRLTLAGDRNPGSDLKAIKEQIRQIPANGIGYGLLRYTARREELQDAQSAEILFNYLGQFDQTFDGSGLFMPARESGGLDQSPRRLRSHLLDINGSILQGKLRLGITYSKAIHNRTTIQQLADWYAEELQHLIDHCVQPDTYGRTPSDFPLCALDQPTVDLLTGDDRNVSDIYPVTPMQHGMLFHSVYEADRDAYLSQVIWKLEGTIDTEAFAKAWQLIADRHVALRTGIATDQLGEPLQVAYRHIDVPLGYSDWSDTAEPERERRLLSFLENDREQRFDLRDPPLIRLNLFRFAEGEYRFVWTYHHIVIDGWSVPVVIGELMDAYEAYATGHAPKLGEARPFGDYVEWLCRQEYSSAENFWRENLAGLTAPTPLPAARIAYNPALGQGDYAEQGFSLPEGATRRLKDFARQHRLTLNTLVQGVWSILLGRYSADQQIIFGATTSGRPAELKNVESMVGLLINALPVTAQLRADQAAIKWLAEFQEQQLNARQYEFASLVEVQGWSDVPRGTPLFNTLLVFENYPDVSSLWTRSNKSLAIADMQPIEWTNYPLTAAVSVANQFHLRLDYDKQYYEDEMIQQIADHFLKLLEGIIAEPDRRLGALPMLSNTEKHKLLTDWNDTRFDYPQDLTVHSLFEARAAEQPRAVALRCAGEQISYGELNRRANLLATHLRTLGVERGSLVGISIDRCTHMIAGLLGILKAGAAYVPLDPKYPPDRVAFMLEDSGAPVLLTQESLVEDLPKNSAQLVCLDKFDWGNPEEILPNLDEGANPEDLAYVIYTSGSTGVPKGVAIEHRNTVALIEWASDVFAPEEFAGVLASTSVCFDLSVFEIFCTLGIGGRIILVPDALALPSLPDEVNVTLVNTVPSAIAELLRMNGVPPSVKTVNLAGEPLTTALADSIYALGTVRDVNDLYGPSEDTTYSTWTRRIPGAPPTIGRPVHNTQVYLLDPEGKPVPVGVPGELYLGGAGVSRGYLNRPELTAEKYVRDPFSGEAGARLYRTGDRARYRPDSNIEFLGRLDHQVKLRGFRIELGEIETRIEEHKAVEKALVIVREDNPGDQRLVAYLQAGTENLDRDQIEKWESEQVSQWEDLWQDTYSDNKDVELGSDFSGWISSYTGDPIPVDEMLAWINSTAQRINELKASRILEIGSGTGLVAARVAPHCDHYLATDFSGAVIETLRQLKESRADLGSLEFRQSRADELKDIPPASYDAIIINSVAQYFPDADYFVAVVRQAIEMLADGGHLFLGDLRSLPLLDAYHSSVQLYKASDSLTVANLASRIRQRIDQEEELLVDPAIFAALQAEFPRISGARFQLKRGTARNELTRFRYDVVLEVGSRATATGAPEMVDWRKSGMNLDALATRLETGADQGLLIRGIPDARLFQDAYAMERFTDAGELDVKTLRKEIADAHLSGIEPESVYALMRDRNWDVQILAGETGTFNILCQPATAVANYDGLLLILPRDAEWHEYANDPLRGRLARSLEPLLREKIKADLPEYMMPSAFIIMEAFPLTPNGKIDRKRLPAPEWRPQKEYVAPRTPTEETLADIWADVLRLDRVGIHDDFFALGGHSLLATQVISRVRDQLEAEPELRMLFKHPTIAEFAAILDESDATILSDAIKPVEHANGAVLSFAQQRLWFLDKLEGGSIAYNMAWPLRLKGPLDISALYTALNHLAERHESLRTIFVTRDGEAIQLVAEKADIPLPVIDMRDSSSQDNDIVEHLSKLAGVPFDLEHGPLFGAQLLTLGDQEHILVILIHHIISDAWSMEIVYRELVAMYAAALDNQKADLPNLPVQYPDYAIWQRQMLDSEVFTRQLDYWTERLADAPPHTELPTDRPRPSVQTYAGSFLNQRLSGEISRQLRELAQKQSTTLFVLMQTVFAVLLARYSGQDDIVIGTPIAGRKRSELEGLIGFFLNTLALRTTLDGNPAFTTLLSQVSDNTFDAYEHQDIPFERLVDRLQPVRDMSHSPIFQVMFTVVSPPGNPAGFPQLTVEPVEYDYHTAKFDLMLSVNDLPDRLDISFEYNTDLFDRTTIAGMHEHFRTLLESVVAEPDCPIRDLSMLGNAERQKLLTNWNATPYDYPRNLTVHAMFEQQAAAQPDAPALWANGTTLSYAELNRRANRLATELRVAGARPGTLVGISVERTAHMIAGLLGILKSGAAYVPLDPKYPAERVALMLDDSGAPLLLSQTTVAADLPATEATVICLDTFDWGDPAITLANPESGARATDLAYVIYTSGSTGKPKGVAIEHRNTVALMQWAGDVFKKVELAGVLASTSICFDLSVFEIFCTLGLGGRVVLAADALALPELPGDVGVTLINTVPSAIAELVRSGGVPASVRTVNLAGEPLTTLLADAIYATGTVASVNDLYGPSEDTTYSTWTRREPGETATIGVPIYNTRVYLLDSWGHPVPIGASGELYLGGAGVTRGYLNRPELTAEKFVPDPFGMERNGRLYRTGDKARYRPDGKLEFLGRIDQQIKLRGFRIELGEIEAALDKHPGVQQSLVMVREDSPGDKKLIAYIAGGHHKPEAGDLRSALQARLPDYMVPAAFVILEQFPLLPNGKVNRKALPLPEWQAGGDYAAPRTPTEKMLAGIWSKLLHLDRVGIHDNFFELGGDSILSIRIIARAAQQGLQLTAKQVFSHQTIASLAEAVGTGVRIDAEQGLVSGHVPLSPIQRWFLDFASPNPDHFNQSLVLELDPAIDHQILQAALHAVFLHHDALRLQFHAANQGWIQELGTTVTLPDLQITSLQEFHNDALNAALVENANLSQRSIDIGSGCLMANRLFITADDAPNLLLAAIHHLGVDGISWGILLEDIETACAQLAANSDVRLPQKTTSFKRWTERLHEYADSGALDPELGRWQSIERGTALPLDTPGGENSIATSRTITVALDAAQTTLLLQEVPAAYRTRINDVLLTALARALRNWTAGDAFVIDLESHGREDLFDDADISRTVGWFTTKYPVELRLQEENDFGAHLKAIKEQLRAVPNNGFGYGLLLDAGSLGSEAIKPEIVFNYLGQFGEIFSEAKLLRPSSAPNGVQQGADRLRPHVLDINSSIGKDQLLISIAYSSGLHTESTIQKFADDFLTQLRELIKHCVDPATFGRTPSDFPLCALAQKEVDRLTAHDRNVEDIYPATAMQHGMLFHSIYASDRNAYLSQIIWKLDGELNIDAFAKAWQQVTDRHASLSTAIQSADSGEPLQIAYRTVDMRLQQTDWQTLSRQQQDQQLDAFLEIDSNTRFELDSPPLMRLNLFRISATEYRFVWTYHHTVIDGWSIPVVVGELLETYLAFVENRKPRLQDARPYRDYIAWLNRQDHQLAADFWGNMLAGISAPTELPASRVAYNPAAGQGEYSKEFFALPEAATDELKHFARANRLTMNTLAQGVWSILLSRYSGNDRVIFGATTSGRPAELQNVEAIVGLLINSLPVATTIDEHASTLEWLGKLQEQQLSARQYEFASLVEIQGWSAIPRGTPLFNTLLVFENYPEVGTDVLANPAVPAITYLQPVEWTHYPLTAAVMISNQFVLRLDYDTQYYDKEIISQLGRHFVALLESIVAEADQPVTSLTMIGDHERQHLLTDWNATDVAYPPEATLQSLLESQTAATPEAEALVFGEASLTYAELNARANQLAHWLIAQDTSPDDLIGVCMERSIEMVVALLGIIKAGLAYVPLDPDYPEQRLEHMLEDGDIKILLAQSGVQEVLPVHSVPVLLLDEVKLDGQPCDNPPARSLPDNLAYVIFTSGSTGRPKGVMNEHRGIVNRLLWMQDEYGLTSADRVLQKTPFSFDVSVWEFFWPLISGATLVVAKPGGHKDPAYLAQTIDKESITTLHFVPSMLQVFLQEPTAAECTSLKQVICSGEALSHDLQTRFYKLYASTGLHNLYGPTEAAIDVTYWACPRDATDKVVPIGRPVANTHIYIVDKMGNSVPVGVPGELWIGGIQVARGYVNRPDLTAERFTPDPFHDDSAARIYKTGDLVRYRAEGTIEFLGRIDHQIKLRGFRIELGEIEASLDALPQIEQSLVLLREDTPGDKRLVAYVSGGDQAEPDVTALRETLQQELPDYMMPGAFVVLDAFPLLPNGKVDRKALPQPDWHGEHEYVAPRSTTELVLAEIWQAVLKVEQVGIHDDFFELGGHSLLATQIVARVRNAFGMTPELRLLFSNPTLEGFAAQLDSVGEDATAAPPIVAVPHADGAPLSFAQQRLWFLDQLEEGGASYNVSSPIRLSGSLNPDALEEALNDLVARHESLRTTFTQTDEGTPIQIIAPELRLSLIKTDLSTASQGDADRKLTQLARTAFDLANGPLLRLHVLKIAAEQHIVLLVIHHIVSDAWSLNTFFSELMLSYDARRQNQPAKLPLLPIQYADYAIWQRSWLAGEELDKQIEYWKSRLAGAPAAINLPVDHPHPPVQTYEGAIISRTLQPELHKQLETIARQNNATLFMTLLAAFNVLLQRYTGEDDIVIGTPVSGRSQSETEGLIGFFLNTLALRTDLSKNPSFSSLLRQLSHDTLDAYAHQDLPFESLVEALTPVRDMSRSPIFQVLFTLQNSPQTEQKFEDLQLESVALKQNTAKFELSLGVQTTPEGLLAGFEYNTDLFDRATIERMFDHFERLLAGIVADTLQPINDIQLLTGPERNHLLVDLNATQVAYPADATLPGLLDAQVAATPGAEALVYGDNSLSYAELNRRANQLAHWLIARGTQPDDLVGVCMERSIEMVVALLGIVKAGLAYVPLDPDYPQQRLEHMLEDAEIKVILSKSSVQQFLPAHTPPVLLLDTGTAELSTQPTENPASRALPKNLAYVIFTSGSTGRPKGVMNEHRGIVNRLLWMQDEYELTTADRILQKTPFSFDVSVWEFFWPLINGATLVMAEPGGHQDPAYLAKLINSERITTMHFVPSMLDVFLQDEAAGSCTSLKRVICSGEALAQGLQNSFYKLYSATELHNLYGPTEAAIDVTYWACQRDVTDGVVPIGRPVANTHIYIVDKAGNPTPVGVPGELWIGGVQVARGYVNRPELTRERFIADPFSNDDRARVYKTGDLVRYRADDAIEFLGRIDHQVKLRGFRIELDEIEAAMRSSALIDQAVVLLREDKPGDQRLIGYLTTTAGDIELNALREQLYAALPGYMVPSGFMVLDKIPLTPNGKVNRNALPIPEWKAEQEYVAPSTPNEAALAEIWETLLQLEKIGVHDNFFVLGGHSLLATQLVSRIRNTLNLELPLMYIFDYPSIASLATAVDAFRLATQAPAAGQDDDDELEDISI